MHTLLCVRDFPYAIPTIKFCGLILKALQSEVSILTARKAGEDPSVGQAVMEQAAGLLPVTPAARIVRYGSPLEEILAEASIERYELFAVGTSEHFTLGDLFLGELARRLVAQAQISVLVVRNPKPKIRTILIPTSGQEASYPVVEVGARLAQALDAQATLLHVTGTIPSMYTGLEHMEETLDELLQSDTIVARNLKEQASQLRGLGVDAQLELRHGVPAEEILRAIDVHDFDLVVVGGTKHRGLERFFMEDVSQEMVARAPCPVLVMRRDLVLGE